MNEEGMSLKSLIVKILLVVLFVFLLMWLFPMPNMKPVYDRLFVENIDSMKDASKDYFTVERLPKNVGDKVDLTLEEMYSMKLVLPFKDSAGKACDTKASYVEVVKMDNEYLMKINLSCSTKADYLVDHIGCTNVCPNSNCNNQTVQPTGMEYRFSQTLYDSYKVVAGEYKEYEQIKYKDVLDGYTYSCKAGTQDSKNEKNCIVKKGTVVSEKATKTKDVITTVSEKATKTKTVPDGTKSEKATKTKTIPDGTKSEKATKTKTVPDGTKSVKATKTKTVPDGTKSVKATKTKTVSNGTLSTPATSFTSWADKGVVTSKTPLSLNPSKILMRDLTDIKLAQRDCSTCASYTLYIYEQYTRTASCGSNAVDPANKANCLIPQTKVVADCSPYANDPNHVGYCLVPQTKVVADCSPYANDPNHVGYCLVPQTKVVPDCGTNKVDPNHAGYCLVPQTKVVADCSPNKEDPNHAGYCLVPKTKVVPDCGTNPVDSAHAGYCLVTKETKVADCNPNKADPNHEGYCLVPQTKVVPDCGTNPVDSKHAGYCLVTKKTKVADCNPNKEDPKHAGYCLVTKTSDDNVPAEATPKYKKVPDGTTWSKTKTLDGWTPTGNERTKEGSYKKYSGWVKVIPAGYTKYKEKTDYKWSNTKTLDGWVLTGETRVLTLENTKKTCTCE